MENLENLEIFIKRADRTKNDIIKYLIASQKQMRVEGQKFANSAEFQDIRKKLQDLKVN